MVVVPDGVVPEGALLNLLEAVDVEECSNSDAKAGVLADVVP